jgi:hypothetical protein
LFLVPDPAHTLTRLVDLWYLPTLAVGTLFLLSQAEALCRAWVAYRSRP